MLHHLPPPEEPSFLHAMLDNYMAGAEAGDLSHMHETYDVCRAPVTDRPQGNFWIAESLVQDPPEIIGASIASANQADCQPLTRHTHTRQA
eukprot:m.148865 g.148865  ORF g.148865 m.148865 type:complete len:91 (+) comp10122_c0_seq16:2679-2951(+)